MIEASTAISVFVIRTLSASGRTVSTRVLPSDILGPEYHTLYVNSGMTISLVFPLGQMFDLVFFFIYYYFTMFNYVYRTSNSNLIVCSQREYC